MCQNNDKQHIDVSEASEFDYRSPVTSIDREFKCIEEYDNIVVRNNIVP